jgi:glycosyltransferase involved in cell wall biosynthesis
MNVLYLTSRSDFPCAVGGSATRIVSIAKGLMEEGATVHVLSAKPSLAPGADDAGLPAAGTQEGISFEYTCGRRAAARTRIGAAYLYLKGLWGAARAVRRIARSASVDAILLGGVEAPEFVVLAKLLARSVGAPLIGAQSEFPFVYRRKTFAMRVQQWLCEHLNFNYKLLDGMIVISNHLYDYFSTRLRRGAALLRVPILVDVSAFPQHIAKPGGGQRLVTFCGNLEHKGEVECLLRAFAAAAGDCPDWGLQVIGASNSPKRMEDLRALVTKLRLEGRVHFRGAVARNDIPSRLMEGDVMALPRASGVFSQAGFPTKLGEYLATGKPVVVTGTGDIPRYLEDGVSAYLVPPDDVGAFAERLRFVMTHPLEAETVGRRGREVAVGEFDYRIHGRRIFDFIRKLNRH